MDNLLKLRAWHIVENKMIEFDDLNLELEDGEYTIWGSDGIISYGYDLEDFVIMTCLGIKDKAGKDIYVGDIVRLPKCDNAIRVVEKGSVNYYLKGYGTGKDKYDIEFSKVVSSDNFEVLGNIYENKELLEEV